MNLENKLREAIVDLDKAAKSESSGFKAHNPQIAEFARKSPENLATVIAFCVGTQLVDWQIIAAQFGQLVAVLHDEGKLKGGYDKAYKTSPYYPIVANNPTSKMGGINHAWENRNKYFDDIYGPKGILGSDFHYNTCGIENSYKAYKLHAYAEKNFRQIGIPKAGFFVQLVTGMSGCFDSINRQLYFIRNDIYDKVFTKSAKFQASKDEKKMQEILKNYDQMLHTFHKYENANEMANYRLWDDWCRIVAQRIRQMNRTEKSNAASNVDTTVTAKLGKNTQDLATYDKKFQADFPDIKNYVEKSKDITGFDVSGQHRKVMDPGYKGESLENKFRTLLEKYLAETEAIPEAEFSHHSDDRINKRIGKLGDNDLSLAEKDKIAYVLKRIKEINFPKNKTFAIMLCHFRANPKSEYFVELKDGNRYYQINDIDDMAPSMGDQFWAIVRNNVVSTIFLRKSVQTKDIAQNNAKLYVDATIKNIDNYKIK